MRLNYNNGYYEGEVNSKNEEHGYGTFVWNNGDKYVGYFKNRLFNGQGTYYYANGNKYVGSWVDDKKSGKGTMYFANGFIYIIYVIALFPKFAAPTPSVLQEKNRFFFKIPKRSDMFPTAESSQPSSLPLQA